MCLNDVNSGTNVSIYPVANQNLLYVYHLEKAELEEQFNVKIKIKEEQILTWNSHRFLSNISVHNNR